MPRYEHGALFWQVSLSGATVTTTSGRRGSRAHTSTKTLASPRAAQRHHDQLIVGMLRSGYRPVDAPAIVSSPDALALEACLADDPDDPEAWMVYGDLLQKVGDPRGELIALHTAAQATGAPKTAKLAVKRQFARHVPTLLGPLARHVPQLDDLESPPFAWKHGFIHRVALDGGCLASVADEVLGHPSGKFVAELAFQTRHPSQAIELFDVIARHAPRALQELDLVVRADLDAIAELWPHVPRLRRLYLAAKSFELGDLRLPELRAARFRGLTVSPSCVDSIAAAPWPKLERMELRLGNQLGALPATFENLEPLLRRGDMPALTHLKIRGAAFAGAICRALATSPLAAQLQVLDLAHGTITPQDVKVLAAATGRFANLRELWVPAAALWNDGAKRLAGISNHVISDDKAPLDTLEAELGDDA